jgi:hypothetical protein
MKSLPDLFLVLNHEGLHKVSLNIEAIQSIDHLLAKFTTEKLILARDIAEHSFGMIHQAIWTSEPARYMTVLELNKGSMILDTQYKGHTSTEPDSGWVSPCFVKGEGTFALRCAFEFEKWAAVGLRMFLALNHSQHCINFWVYYSGQVYHVPFGNLFEGTEQICLGHNAKLHSEIFHDVQSRSTSLTKAMHLLSISTWNSDTFNGPRNIPILRDLVRFDSNPDKTDLPMMEPINPEQIKKSPVVTVKDLITITGKIINP